MRIDFAPFSGSYDTLPLVGPEAAELLRVQEIQGLGNPRARAITTTGPGLHQARIQEVLSELPVQMSMSGLFVATDLDAVVRRYAALLDFQRGAVANGEYRPALLRFSDSVGELHRRVVVARVDLPQAALLGGRARRFEFEFESYEAAWRNPTARVAALGTTTGGYTVFNYGNRPTWPSFTFVVGAGGLAALTVRSDTHASRQVSLTASYPEGTTITLNMDPDAELAVAGGAAQQSALAFGDRRFALWPGANTITLTVTGTLTSASCTFSELWPGV